MIKRLSILFVSLMIASSAFGAASDIADYGSGSNTITAVGTTTSQNTTVKVWDYCYDMDGNSDYAAVDGLITQLTGATTGTYCAWIYADADSGSEEWFFNVSKATGAEYMITLRFDYAANRFEAVSYKDNGVAWNWYGQTTVGLTGKWIWVCMTHNGTTPQFYIDNVEDVGTFLTTTELTFWWGDAITGGANAVSFGAHRAAGGVYQYFNGKMDDSRIFTNVLTSDERATLYNSGNGTQDAIGDEVFWMHSEPVVTGWVHTINGVVAGSMASVNGVARASISKINQT